ncbi:MULTISPECIES: class I SAM-dependent methyltransferase [unclassified Rhizobium]|uniref:O-methyltransferase n=1 Tax=unclassified Rhizobium TaxID=2613769 RepID=UPI00160A2C32|nr:MULTISPECIES: class I SAM-dependent methyltransferase [unclassified Rhizobium]MBB3287323.1 putative O-methyltransferase YrrM [Rhizobium sp. BK252]MBB3402063.1 putative O-methyltransferase YrrM [Rhizobium sp. BK289]MBB3414640.1 putative O-methyltransferase YrrM [Rhizobium sp. BK284]MBB3482529.1 putative O-methyltransferase YrrM [Rhizobium sp. BK347]MDK4721265.1 class I SAM-dependent methyltransferase [Rhizobium sp. CNPSo 3968]
MDSLSNGPIADVLQRLHQEADAADAPLMQTFESNASTVEQAMTQVIEAETRDMAGLYHGYADNFLSVSPEFGHFLYMSARSCKAKRIVEFGSSMGISAIYMAAALHDMGGGALIGTELEPSKGERAKANLMAAGLADLVEFRIGDARETLKPSVGGDIDMVLLDGAFTLYLPILKLLEPHLKPGAIIIGENAFAEAGGYIDYVRDPRNGYLSLSLSLDPGRGNELTVKTK